MKSGGGPEVTDLPRTPFVDGQMVPEDPQATRITADYSVLWARLFNLQYELMLVDIAFAISRPHGTPQREGMVGLCKREMRQVIRTVSAYLTDRPLSEGQIDLAGPPYGLDNEFMPDSDAAFQMRYTSLGTTNQSIIEQIKQSPEHADDLPGLLRLRSIEDIDQARQSLLQP